MKSQMAALVPQGLDMAAFSLLFTLVRCGPKRQGELAELALLDPSTVSRHVAQLARAGYVQRRPDPQDGRAVQLVATEGGQTLAAEIGQHRQAMITQALAAWAPQDLHHLVTLMARLNDDLDAFRPHLVRSTTGAFGDQPAPRPRRGIADLIDASDPSSPDQENA
jgi:DNA-binding MarR family transcriptional regulator